MRVLYGYIVWFIVTVFVVYAFCLNTASAVFADVIKSSLQVSNYGASFATGAFILGFACMQIPAGYLLDRFPTRYVVCFGISLLAIGNIFISISDGLMLFASANFIQGMGASFAFIASAVLIAQWFPAKMFPILLGITQTLSCIFAGIVHYYFVVSLTTNTWNDLYKGLALFGFILLIISYLIIKSPKNHKSELDLSFIESLKIVFKNKQIVLCCSAAALSFGVLLAYAGLWYMQVERYYSVDNLHASKISALIFLGFGIGTPILGWISNKVKSRIMIVHIGLVTGTMALLLGLYLPHYEWHAYLITKIIAFCIGFLLSGCMLFYTMVSELSSDKTRGVALSLLNTSVFLFNTLLLFVPYLFITALAKDFFTYLWVLPFCVLCSILLIYFIKDTYVLSDRSNNLS